LYTYEEGNRYAAWPWGMNEEADVNVGNFGNQQTEQLGYEKEAVVMYPSEVSRTMYSTRDCGISMLMWGRVHPPKGRR
jgi:hypothetical protein